MKPSGLADVPAHDRDRRAHGVNVYLCRAHIANDRQHARDARRLLGLLSLSDDQLARLMSASKPLQPEDRPDFLAAVALAACTLTKAAYEEELVKNLYLEMRRLAPDR